MENFGVTRKLLHGNSFIMTIKLMIFTCVMIMYVTLLYQYVICRCRDQNFPLGDLGGSKARYTGVSAP